MGFTSSPEGDDPAKKTTPTLDFSGIQSPLMLPDRNDEFWKRSPQSAQKAPDMPTLPSLEVQQKADPRLSLPPELLQLYGDPALLPRAPGAKPDTNNKDKKPEAPPNIVPPITLDWGKGPGDRPPVTPPLDRTPIAPPVDRTSASPVKLDEAGYATDITYPDGKTRHIDRDPQTHEAKAITTKNSEGTTKLVNQNGRWMMEIQGMQLPFPGKVEASKDGDISMQTSADGVWRVEKPNGTVTEEKENADGARVSFDSNHKLSKITRKDGTSYEQLDQNTIVETHPGGKPITWKNQGSSWTSDNGDKPRKNLTLHDNAAVTFDDANGIKHTINGRGAETLEGAGLGKITPDAQNRPAEVETADGKRVRKYDYFDDKSNDVKSVTITDKVNNTTTVYTRDSKDSNQWRSDKGGVWSGEIRVSPDGVHSIRAAQGGDSDNGGKWTSYYPDGRETSDSINSDGSRASYDKQGNLVNFQGADGVRIDRLKVGDQDTLRYYDPKAGETVTWTKGGDGNWTADSARFKEPRKDLSFNTKGELSYTNDRGGRVEEHRDGTKLVADKDGTKLDFDKDGQITKATKGNLERTFIRDSGGIAQVKDKNLSTKEERTVFERRAPGEENRKNIHVSANGDLSYQNQDGTAVIERSNMMHLDLDKDGDITRVVGPKGTRTFQYVGDADHKQVAQITDSKTQAKGPPKVEQWTRVANPDGSLSPEFRSQDEKGKERKSRYNITPCADGEYEYRLATDKANDKPHVEKLGGSSGDMPASIEDARSELSTVLEANMDKARFDANVGFMKKFEQRMMDQAELQIAGGIDADKVMRETERCIVDTYVNCAKLAGTAKGNNEMYGQKDRIRLAENVLYLAQDPSDIKQGSQGTCWWESSWNVGLFQRNAGDAARFVSDIALTSKYTSTAGPLRGGPPKTITIPKQYVQLNSRDSGAGWTPQNAKSGSQRSMVGMLVDQVGPPLGGQRSWGQSDGGWHSEARNILYMLTGRDNIRHGSDGLGRHEKAELLKTGGFTSSGGGHMWAYTMHKENGQWVVIRDDQYNNADRVVQRISNLQQWLSGDVKSEAQKGWKAHPARPTDSNDSDTIPVPRPNPNPSPDNRPRPDVRPRPQPRPSDDDDDDNNNDDNYNGRTGRINVVQMPRPVWRAAQRRW
jgi:hypothetical protein